MDHSQYSAHHTSLNLSFGTSFLAQHRSERQDQSFENANAWSSRLAPTMEISIACRGLTDADTFSKSDPMVVMSVQDVKTNKWKEFGRTETIRDTLNPEFVEKFRIEYYFEEKQRIKFDIYDIDSKSPDLSKHDFLGQAFCTLGEIIKSPGGRWEKPLQKRSGQKTKGCIIVTTEELLPSRNVVTMRWSGKKLDKKDLFGKSDPFMVFLRSHEDNNFTVCHKTEKIKRTLNPSWDKFSIDEGTLCFGDRDRTIKIEVYDWDRDGGHDFIGSFKTNLNQLSRGVDNTFKCINQKKVKKKGYKDSGELTLEEFEISEQATFLDYIRCRTELSFVVAIDFSSSNGDPLQPDSFHYISSSKPNQYTMAIQAVGSIVQDYDTDKLFPAYGFGARVPPSRHVSHEFPINFNFKNPDCKGIAGVLDAYKACLRKIELHGPTNFAPIIRRVANSAAGVTDASQYFILLILTDGVISDMEATKEAIVQAAWAPMSIIIVGIGNADFGDMNELDGDDVRVSYKGVEADRDIVQFVPFREYTAAGNEEGLSEARMAKEVLREIPDQFVEYMKNRNLKPLES